MTHSGSAAAAWQTAVYSAFTPVGSLFALLTSLGMTLKAATSSAAALSMTVAGE
jgi:hypothetical protein